MGGDDIPTVIVPVRPQPVVVVGEFDGVLPSSLLTVDMAVGEARRAATGTLAIVLHDTARRRFVMPPWRRCELLVQRGVTSALVANFHRAEDVGSLVASVARTCIDVGAHVDRGLSLKIRTSLVGLTLHSPPVQVADEAEPGSDLVIAALDAGDVRQAAILLGRPHDVLVSLTTIDRNWSLAELIDPPAVMPAAGRYLVSARTTEGRAVAVATVGARGTMHIGYFDHEIEPADMAAIAFIDRSPPTSGAQTDSEKGRLAIDSVGADLAIHGRS